MELVSRPMCKEQAMSKRNSVMARSVRWLLVLLIVAAAGMAGAAPQRLTLDQGDRDVDAWPWVRMLHDESDALTLAQVRASPDRFVLRQSVYANLGIRRGAVWLRLPFDSAATDRTPWWIDLGFPGIDTVDVYLFDAGAAAAVQQVRVGIHVPQDQRILNTQHHVVPLTIQPGHHYELLLRFESPLAQLVPLRLMRPEAYGALESSRLALQGLISGIWLCMLIYALVQWLHLRERMFLDFALGVTAANLFFLSYHGLGSQYFWGGSLWLAQHMWVPAVFTMIAANAMFAHDALAVASWSRRLAYGLRAVCWVAVGTVAAFVAGWIDTGTVVATASVVGAMPLVLGSSAAWYCLRRGDKSARLIFAGWFMVLIGSVLLISVEHGLLPLNETLQDALQYAMTAQMVLWMFALARHARDVRMQAESELLERAHLEALAYLDPLTGLLNRRGLQRELERCLPAVSAVQPLGLYLLDLDGFKPINDTLGHDAGDEVLRIVGLRLKAQMRSFDVVARLGGDEFVVAAPRLTDAVFANALSLRMLAAFEEPFLVDGKPCRVGATVGYALVSQDGIDMASLFKRADAAMYRGKQLGRGCAVQG
jgi:diguanylate cyclase (GGDEF)-like protein